MENLQNVYLMVIILTYTFFTRNISLTHSSITYSIRFHAGTQPKRSSSVPTPSSDAGRVTVVCSCSLYKLTSLSAAVKSKVESAVDASKAGGGVWFCVLFHECCRLRSDERGGQAERKREREMTRATIYLTMIR